jgi:hypothetical protein
MSRFLIALFAMVVPALAAPHTLQISGWEPIKDRKKSLAALKQLVDYLEGPAWKKLLEKSDSQWAPILINSKFTYSYHDEPETKGVAYVVTITFPTDKADGWVEYMFRASFKKAAAEGTSLADLQHFLSNWFELSDE